MFGYVAKPELKLPIGLLRSVLPVLLVRYDATFNTCPLTPKVGLPNEFF